MSPKRATSAAGSSSKRRRKVLSLSEKVKILDKLKSGSSAASLASEYGLNESTVRYIKKAEDKIRSSVQASAKPTLKAAYVSRRNPYLEKMEKMLSVWIEDQTQKNAPLSGTLIRAKAASIFEDLKDSVPLATTSKEPELTFQASRGWFDNFKKRFNLHNLKLVGESASADHEAARAFPTQLLAHIQEKGYHPDQVFNADETGLFWKKMPARTYISRDAKVASGFKVAKDRLTLLFCGNASGDFKCKPLLVYRAENPRALKNKKKADLPVFWRSNRKAWVTAQIFEDWFQNCFCTEVKRYLEKKNMAFKVLLLIDNAPGHPQALSVNTDVEVMFLPPNTTSLLQPLDQGIIANFKAYYIRRSFSHILHCLEENPGMSVKECWSQFTILNAIENIAASWKEVKSSTVNACWKKLWPQCVQGNAVEPDSQTEIEKVVELARQVGEEGFENVEVADVEELTLDEEEGLTHMELEELTREDSVVSSDDDEDELQITNLLTTKSLQAVLDKVSELKREITEIDPDTQRSTVTSRGLDNIFSPYRELLKELRSRQIQKTITDFFKKETIPTPEPPTTQN